MNRKKIPLRIAGAILLAFGILLCGHTVAESLIRLDRAYAKEDERVVLVPSANWSLVLTVPMESEDGQDELLDIIRDDKLTSTLEKDRQVLCSEEWLAANAPGREIQRIWLTNSILAQYGERDATMDREVGERYATLTAQWKAEKEAREREEALAANAAEKGLTYRRNPDFCMELTEEEYECLLRIVQAEAPNEPIEGKILVANVVLNRVISKQFPNSVIGVVFQKKQFAPISDGAYYRAKVSDETREAVRRALEGEDYSEGALYFFARKWTSEANARWFDTCLTKVVKFGCHEFYK